MSDRIIFALIGAIIGSIASGLFISKYCKKVCGERISELEGEIKQLRAKNRLEKEQELTRKENKLREEEADVDISLLAQRTKMREERRSAEEKAKELGYSPEDDEDIDFDDPFEDEDTDETVIIKQPEEDKPHVFKIIDQEAYEQDFEFRDSECFMFYKQDHVLADAFDDEVSDAEDVIGRDALAEADETEDGYLYVLDETENKMYEIEINREESFYRDILRGGAL